MVAAYLLRRMEVYIARENIRAKESDQPESAAKPGVILPLWALIVPLVSLTILRGADSTRGVYLSLVMFQLFKDATIAP